MMPGHRRGLDHCRYTPRGVQKAVYRYALATRRRQGGMRFDATDYRRVLLCQAWWASDSLPGCNHCTFPTALDSWHHARMPVRHITAPTRIVAAGNKPKDIDEYVGRVTTNTDAVSIAHMRSPAGWVEPGQTPEFDEYTVVLKGMLRVKHAGGSIDVHAGQAIIAPRG